MKFLPLGEIYAFETSQLVHISILGGDGHAPSALNPNRLFGICLLIALQDPIFLSQAEPGQEAATRYQVCRGSRSPPRPLHTLHPVSGEKSRISDPGT